MNRVDIEFIRKVQEVGLKQKLPLNTEVHYELLNTQQQIVMSKTVMNFSDSAFAEKLEISHLPAGEYTLVVSTGNPHIVLDTININL
jgi:diaminopimelate epimerase